MRQFDSIILGGGLAGLSLALALKDQSILILESRQHYTEDRTFCFWNVHPHPFEHLVQYKWSRWKVRYEGETLNLEGKFLEYHCLPSQVFYQEALNRLLKRENTILLMDQKVEDVIEETRRVVVKSNQETFYGSKVYSSIPCKTNASLSQHFLGWHVKADHSSFDAKSMTLMDFDVSQHLGLNFMYVLPFSETEALFESTFISPSPLPNACYEQVMQDYLTKRYRLKSFKILAQERGVLPLNTEHAKPTKRLIPIGARAGWMRASTGYAFLETQKQVQNLVKFQKPDHRDKIQNSLDKLFLAFLKKYPERGPELFFNLFKKNSSDQMVRFLMGGWSYQDLLKIILSMPKRAMIKEALQ